MGNVFSNGFSCFCVFNLFLVLRGREIICVFFGDFQGEFICVGAVGRVFGICVCGFLCLDMRFCFYVFRQFFFLFRIFRKGKKMQMKVGFLFCYIFNYFLNYEILMRFRGSFFLVVKIIICSFCLSLGYRKGYIVFLVQFGCIEVFF